MVVGFCVFVAYCSSAVLHILCILLGVVVLHILKEIKRKEKCFPTKNFYPKSTKTRVLQTHRKEYKMKC